MDVMPLFCWYWMLAGILMFVNPADTKPRSALYTALDLVVCFAVGGIIMPIRALKGILHERRKRKV